MTLMRAYYAIALAFVLGGPVVFGLARLLLADRFVTVLDHPGTACVTLLCLSIIGLVTFSDWGSILSSSPWRTHLFAESGTRRIALLRSLLSRRILVSSGVVAGMVTAVLLVVRTDHILALPVMAAWIVLSLVCTSLAALISAHLATMSRRSIRVVGFVAAIGAAVSVSAAVLVPATKSLLATGILGLGLVIGLVVLVSTIEHAVLRADGRSLILAARRRAMLTAALATVDTRTAGDTVEPSRITGRSVRLSSGPRRSYLEARVLTLLRSPRRLGLLVCGLLLGIGCFLVSLWLPQTFLWASLSGIAAAVWIIVSSTTPGLATWADARSSESLVGLGPMTTWGLEVLVPALVLVLLCLGVLVLAGSVAIFTPFLPASPGPPPEVIQTGLGTAASLVGTAISTSARILVAGCAFLALRTTSVLRPVFDHGLTTPIPTPLGDMSGIRVLGWMLQTPLCILGMILVFGAPGIGMAMSVGLASALGLAVLARHRFDKVLS